MTAQREGLAVTKTAHLAAAIVGAAMLCACSTAANGAPSTNPAVAQSVDACKTAVDAAVRDGKELLASLEAGRSAPTPAVTPTARIRGACGSDTSSAWSQFIVRTHDEYTASTTRGAVAMRRFLLAACGTDTMTVLGIDQLGDDAREACKDT